MKLIDIDAEVLAAKLTEYLDNDDKLKAIYDYTKLRYEVATDLSAHNWAHTYRDIISAIVIGEAEGADMAIVLPAITMHDIGFFYGADGKTHGAIGAEKVAQYLNDADVSYSDEQINAIADCIRTHKGSMHNEHPESLEARVVADADLLDKFGPFGVYQKIRVYTEFNMPIEKIIAEGENTDNLTMETPTGQQLADRGRAFVIEFFKELKEANEPYSIDV